MPGVELGAPIVQFSFEIQDMETNLSLTANFSLVDASDPEIVTRDLLGFLLHGNEILTVLSIYLFKLCLFVCSFLFLCFVFLIFLLSSAS